jgi:hypothetical protein
VLPWKKSRLLKAVKKCFHRAVGALQSSNAAEEAKSTQSAPDDPVKALKEQLKTCKLRVVTPRKKVPDDEIALRQKADGFVIDGVTYIKQDRLKAWVADKSNRIALRQAGIFLATRPDTSTITKKVIGITGKPRYYAINASALELSESADS